MEAVFPGIGFAAILPLVIIYFSVSLPLYLLANKADYDNPWFAFVPLLNMILVVQLARQSLWVLLLAFIPLANVLAAIYVTYMFLKAFGRSGIEMLLLFIPIVNCIYLFYLGLSDSVEYQHTTYKPTGALY